MSNRWAALRKDATTVLDEALEERDPSAVADVIEFIASERKSIKAYDEHLRNVKALAESNLVLELGDGEAVVAPLTGRAVFRTTEPVGAARVNEGALQEHADELPEDCKPQRVWKYPGVMALRQAADMKQISPELLDELLIKPEPAVVLRWRTMS